MTVQRDGLDLVAARFEHLGSIPSLAPRCSAPPAISKPFLLPSLPALTSPSNEPCVSWLVLSRSWAVQGREDVLLHGAAAPSALQVGSKSR